MGIDDGRGQSTVDSARSSAKRRLRSALFVPAGSTSMCSLADQCVIAHDLRRGIPFADESFDVVYHSHVLEHLSRKSRRTGSCASAAAFSRRAVR